MIFITNREPKGSIRTRVGRPFKFDLNKNSSANSVYYCERTSEDNYTEIGSTELLKQLKESDYKQILLFIHGFSNLPEPDIFPRTQELQDLFDEKEQNLVKVIPIIWPCDNDIGIVKDYWDDQKSADMSAFAFARVLEKFLDWRKGIPDEAPCLKRINVLAHSMGNRVYRETLHQWNKYDLADGVPLLFRNSILMAADIVNESLEEDQKGRLISQASKNVTVYYASDDLALRSSKASNLRNKVASRRLGHSGPEDMKKTQTNVYAVDCDEVNTTYDYPKGHSYFLRDKDGAAGLVFNHLFESIKTGVVNVDNEKRKKII